MWSVSMILQAHGSAADRVREALNEDVFPKLGGKYRIALLENLHPTGSSSKKVNNNKTSTSCDESSHTSSTNVRKFDEVVQGDKGKQDSVLLIESLESAPPSTFINELRSKHPILCGAIRRLLPLLDKKISSSTSAAPFEIFGSMESALEHLVETDLSCLVQETGNTSAEDDTILRVATYPAHLPSLLIDAIEEKLASLCQEGGGSGAASRVKVGVAQFSYLAFLYAIPVEADHHEEEKGGEEGKEHQKKEPRTVYLSGIIPLTSFDLLAEARWPVREDQKLTAIDKSSLAVAPAALPVICRAQWKMREALRIVENVFNQTAAESKRLENTPLLKAASTVRSTSVREKSTKTTLRCLDIGASPGGWTQELLQSLVSSEADVEVFSVDAGKLNLKRKDEKSVQEGEFEVFEVPLEEDGSRVGKVLHLRKNLDAKTKPLFTGREGLLLDAVVCDINQAPDLLPEILSDLPLRRSQRGREDSTGGDENGLITAGGAVLILTFKNCFPTESRWEKVCEKAETMLKALWTSAEGQEEEGLSAPIFRKRHLLSNTTKETTMFVLL